MERSSDTGSTPVTSHSEHAASDIHTASSRVLRWSLLALAAGGVSYVAGFQRLWSGRVVKLALLGSAIGGLGAHLTRPKGAAKLMNNIFGEIEEEAKQKQATVKEMQEALGKEFDPKQPVNELAKRLEKLGKGSEALDTYMCYHGLSISNVDSYVMGSRKPVTLIRCDVNRLSGSDDKMSPLFKEALLRVLQKQTHQVSVRIQGELKDAIFFLDLLQGQHGLVAIDCSDKGDEEAAKKLMELLDSCPQLAEVPHLSKQVACQQYSWTFGRERILVDIIDKLEEKQRKLKEAATN